MDAVVKDVKDFETTGTMASLQIVVHKEDVELNIKQDFDNPKGITLRITPVSDHVAQAYLYLYLDSAEDGVRFKSLWDDSDSAKFFLRYASATRSLKPTAEVMFFTHISAETKNGKLSTLPVQKLVGGMTCRMS